MSDQVTTVTFIKYPSKFKWWAFTQMGKWPPATAIHGLQFSQLMGSGGRQGFSILPDFSTYVLFAIWTHEHCAHQFFESSKFDDFGKRSDEVGTIFMKTLKAHGQWHGNNHFEVSAELKNHQGLVAVLTRATIRPLKLLSFWRNVGSASKDILGAEGLIYAKGVGEYPLFMQATFSFWRDIKDVHQYAYKRPAHAKVIQKTRKLDWYAEELFANFVPYKETGSMNLLRTYLDR